MSSVEMIHTDHGSFELLHPGIYHGVSMEHYNALPYVRNGFLKKLGKCPANAKVEDPEDTKALRFGRAAHVITLEGTDVFDCEYLISPEDAPKRPTDRQRFAKKPSAETIYACDFWDHFDRLANGRTVFSREDYATLLGVRNSVRTHPFAKLLLAEGVSETTVIFDVTVKGVKIRCKCRPDRTPSVEMATLLDLKTAEDSGLDAFLRSCIKYGYIQQAAFYIDGYNAVRHLPMKKLAAPYFDTGTKRTVSWELDKSAPVAPEMDAFAFIAVEKKAPFRCEVWEVDHDFLKWGRGEYERLLDVEATCRLTKNPETGEAGFWPHYQTAGSDYLMKPAYLP